MQGHELVDHLLWWAWYWLKCEAVETGANEYAVARRDNYRGRAECYYHAAADAAGMAVPWGGDERSDWPSFAAWRNWFYAVTAPPAPTSTWTLGAPDADGLRAVKRAA